MRAAPKTLIAVTAAAALALAGCGGGNDSTAGNTATTQQTTAGAQKPKPAGSGKSKDNGSQQSTTTSQPTTSSSGGGSKDVPAGVPLSKGGDNSIQTFGGEAAGSDRSQATSAAQAYLNARASKQWDTACSYLAGPIKQQLGALLAQAKTKSKGCSAAMEAMSTGVSPSALRKAAVIHVLSLRVKGPQAFLIYRDGQGTPSALPMAQEGGTWKVGALAGSALLL
jgi:hypothetical protein